MRGVHANTAEVLSLTDDGIRLVLKLSAEACEHLDEAEQERDVFAMHATEMRSLLDRVAVVLDGQPSPAEGGAWEVYTVAEEIRLFVMKRGGAYRRR
jgi:hypothetical protein